MKRRDRVEGYRRPSKEGGYLCSRILTRSKRLARLRKGPNSYSLLVMARNHYTSIESVVRDFFQERGISIIIEPRGSRGPDIESLSPPMVGEIKAQSEVVRDLRGYWGQWNSSQHFGGKTSEYRLRSEFPDDVELLDQAAKGWIAVIYGQLRNYCRVAGVPTGWLVVEGIAESEPGVKKAADYLIANGKVALESWAEMEGIGFVAVRFLQ